MSAFESFAIGFLLAIAGAVHCAAMCGVFALRANAASSWRGALGLAAYVGGKALTYAFLGSLAGALGASILGELSAARRVFAFLVAGAIAIAAWKLWRRSAPGGRLERWASRALTPFVRALAPLQRGPFLLGVTTGFLPCGLTALAVLQAAASSSALHGMFTMIGFGLGTAPALIAVAALGRGLARRLDSSLGRSLAAMVLLAAAATTAWRAYANDADRGCCEESVPVEASAASIGGAVGGD